MSAKLISAFSSARKAYPLLLFVFAWLSFGRCAVALQATVKPPDATCQFVDYDKFIDTLAESATLQQRFTRLSLNFGQLDDDDHHVRRIVKTFGEIPTFHDGRIISSKSECARFHLREKVSHISDAARELILYIDDTGFNQHFFFSRDPDGCCYLASIDDPST
jgi:hypothetical protein